MKNNIYINIKKYLYIINIKKNFNIIKFYYFNFFFFFFFFFLLKKIDIYIFKYILFVNIYTFIFNLL